ncbi:MAG: hypothetical protein ACK4M3_03235 [Pyrobaculum sp.]
MFRRKFLIGLGAAALRATALFLTRPRAAGSRLDESDGAQVDERRKRNYRH